MESVLSALRRGDISCPGLTPDSIDALYRLPLLPMGERLALVRFLCDLTMSESIGEADGASAVLVAVFDEGANWELVETVVGYCRSSSDPVIQVRYLSVLARIFCAGPEIMAEMVRLKVPELIFACCQSKDIMLQVLSMEMIVSLNKSSEFVNNCIPIEFQQWLLSVTDLDSETVNETIAGDALRVLSSALSAPSVHIPASVLDTFMARLETFLSSRNELQVLSGIYCITEYLCSSPNAIISISRSPPLLEAWANNLRSGRVPTQQSFIESLCNVFSVDNIRVQEGGSLQSLYSRISEVTGKDLTEKLVDISKHSPEEVQLSALRLLRLLSLQPWLLTAPGPGIHALLELVLRTGTSNEDAIPSLQAIIDALLQNENVNGLGKDLVLKLQSTKLSKSAIMNPQAI